MGRPSTPPRRGMGIEPGWPWPARKRRNLFGCAFLLPYLWWDKAESLAAYTAPFAPPGERAALPMRFVKTFPPSCLGPPEFDFSDEARGEKISMKARRPTPNDLCRLASDSGSLKARPTERRTLSRSALARESVRSEAHRPFVL